MNGVAYDIVVSWCKHPVTIIIMYQVSDDRQRQPALAACNTKYIPFQKLPEINMKEDRG